MIVELDASEFHRVLPLYRSTKKCFPLISAVIQGKQQGQVFADQPENPSSALVVNKFGFICYIGLEQNQAFDESLVELLAAGKGLKANYLLWYWPPTSWQTYLEQLTSCNVRRRERIRFQFDVERASHLGERPHYPTEFELRQVDIELLPKAEKFGLALSSRFWSSATDFIKNGLGVCLLRNNEMISLCYSACVVDNLAEVDIVTDTAFRGQGLGLVVGQQFNRLCRQKGIMPTWDCFEHNIVSVKLAKTLGFTRANSYPFYSFNF